MAKAILICLVVILSQIQFGFGRENSSEKHYICIDQVAFCENGFFINTDERCLFAENVYQDETGIYYLEDDGAFWVCSKCGTLNSLDNESCSMCGER